MTNNEELKRIMIESKLTRLDVAKLIGWSKPAIDSWLTSQQKLWHRNMPDHALTILKSRARIMKKARAVKAIRKLNGSKK